MTTYNGSLYLREQLESIVNQTYTPNEIIISDDGSNDGTLEILEEYATKFSIIRIVHNDGTHGALGNFLNAFHHTNSDIIFPSDQDDIWELNKIELMVQQINDNVDLVYAQDITFFEDGSTIDDIWHFSDISQTIWTNPLKGHTCAFKRSLIKLYEHSFSVSWDYVLSIYCCITKRYAELPNKLVHWRRHKDAIGQWTEALKTKETHQKSSTKWQCWWYMIKSLATGKTSPAIKKQMTSRGMYLQYLAENISCSSPQNVLYASKVCINYAQQSILSELKASWYYILLTSANQSSRNLKATIGRYMWAFCRPSIDWKALHNEKHLA